MCCTIIFEFDSVNDTPVLSCYGTETVEESSSSRSKYESEVKQLRRAYERLELENHELRSLLQQQQTAVDKGERETPILATGVMLSAVTKTLARKVASQLGADASSSSQDNLEDSMRKVNKYVRNFFTCFFLLFSCTYWKSLYDELLS